MLGRTQLLFFLIILVVGLLSATPSASHGSSSQHPHRGSMRFQLFHRHGRELLGRTIAPKDRLGYFRELIAIDHSRKEMISAKILKRRKAIEQNTLTLQKAIEQNTLILPLPSPSPSSSKTKSYYSTPLTAGAYVHKGVYFTKLRLGTPPQDFLVIADTGSDNTWVNCQYQCPHCLKLSKDLLKRKFFKADKSSSFSIVTCNKELCKLLPDAVPTNCTTGESPCEYLSSYTKGVSTGFYATESATVTTSSGEDLVMKDMVIGCSTSHEGSDSFNSFDGVMALSFDVSSFLAVALETFGHRFSYCLVDHLSDKDISNYMYFGNFPTAPTNLSYASLDERIGAFHGIKVEGISVDGNRLKIPPAVWIPDTHRERGGVILDTGSSLTYLVEPAYQVLLPEMVNPLNKVFREYTDEKIDGFAYCFQADFERDEKKVEEETPKLAIHFEGGAVIKPPVKSYVLDVKENVKCLGIVPSPWPGMSTIGNILQQNFFWEIDLDKKRIGFTPSNCDH